MVPVEMWGYARGPLEFYMDGEKPASGRPMVSFGEHVLEVRVEGKKQVKGILMFATTYDEEGSRASLAQDRAEVQPPFWCRPGINTGQQIPCTPPGTRCN